MSTFYSCVILIKMRVITINFAKGLGGVMGALDIGIDLGTTKIIIYKANEGEVLREPSIVAINTKDDSVLAVGNEALSMLGRTPGYIRAEFPLKDGVISDYRMTEVLLKDCIKRACDSFLVKHRVIICVPSSITDIEKRAVVETVVNAGGRKVFLIDEPIAAAIGANIDITKPNGCMLVDVGGGTSDVAVISLGGVVVSESLRYAGNRIDQEIIKFMTTKYKLSIGQKMAEKMKCEAGNLFNPSRTKMTTVKGRNLLTSYPQQMELSEYEIHEAVAPFGDAIVGCIKRVLEKTPPELSADIIENGILLTGGGSMMNGLPELIEKNTHVETRLAEFPIECVSRGTGKAFAYIDSLQTGFSSESTYK